MRQLIMHITYTLIIPFTLLSEFNSELRREGKKDQKKINNLYTKVRKAFSTSNFETFLMLDRTRNLVSIQDNTGTIWDYTKELFSLLSEETILSLKGLQNPSICKYINNIITETNMIQFKDDGATYCIKAHILDNIYLDENVRAVSSEKVLFYAMMLQIMGNIHGMTKQTAESDYELPTILNINCMLCAKGGQHRLLASAFCATLGNRSLDVVFQLYDKNEELIEPLKCFKVTKNERSELEVYKEKAGLGLVGIKDVITSYEEGKKGSSYDMVNSAINALFVRRKEDIEVISDNLIMCEDSDIHKLIKAYMSILGPSRGRYTSETISKMKSKPYHKNSGQLHYYSNLNSLYDFKLALSVNIVANLYSIHKFSIGDFKDFACQQSKQGAEFKRLFDEGLKTRSVLQFLDLHEIYTIITELVR